MSLIKLRFNYAFILICFILKASNLIHVYTWGYW